MMTHKRYFAATNTYSNESSKGFANTGMVIAFNNKETRDSYVSQSERIATRKINKADIKDYVEAPKPFSGKRRAIDTRSKAIPGGALGIVELMYTDDGINL